jgi:hypothetical protein
MITAMTTNANIFGRKITLFIFLFYFSLSSFSTPKAFSIGEKLEYDAYFNWGMIWLKAAKVDFTVKEAFIKNQKAYQLTVAGSTIKSFDKIFTVRDTLTSFVSQQDCSPILHKRIAHEDSYWAEDHFYFDQYSNQETQVRTVCLRKKTLPSKKNLSLQGSVTDLVTAIYQLRNKDISTIQTGDQIPFSILLENDGVAYNLSLTYKGKTTIKTKKGETYKCHKFIPKLVTGDLFENENDMAIYISNDDRKIPIYVEAKLRVGSIKVYFS